MYICAQLGPVPLLPPILLHHQYLHHPDEDIEEVQLQANTLVDRVLLDDTPLGQSGVVEHFLHVVQGEATKEGKTSI